MAGRPKTAADFLYPIKKHGALKALASTEVTTNETTIAHNLGRTPKNVIPVAQEAGYAYISKAADATNVYIKANATIDVIVYVS